MVYESTISFTLDTICPWTYLGLRRLQAALSQFRNSNPSAPITYTVKYLPYQLYPDASKEGEDKYEWYKKSRYGDSEEKMKMYIGLMTAYGMSCGIDFKFGGTVANTLDAHRVIQHYQEEKGPEVADKLVFSLYSQYFENEKHPSSLDTLLTATTVAGIPGADAKAFIDDEYEGLQDVKMLIREQTGNGVDSVPHIVIEGKRRDITLTGAKEVAEYVKALERVMKESS
ncbi:putative dsba oxidoreductase protein [Venturia nashicola]|uniref:Putative dsba oxidoreductase protein n=1 Tax=Venturia nashicola TaxID=86259 RepID=A0A4Z1P312_9PEZI|nr:putative dsba oxidoreductase protein [Venturia nashicola]